MIRLLALLATASLTACATHQESNEEHHGAVPDEPMTSEPLVVQAPVDVPTVVPQIVDEIPVSPEETLPRVMHPSPGVMVHVDGHLVEIQATVCLDVGWLEQVACGPHSREHEALVVIEESKASQIHAAMLIAGFKPGAPGRWTYDDNGYSVQPPTGDAIDVSFRYETNDGETRTVPVRDWIRDYRRDVDFPAHPWRFAGSTFATVKLSASDQPTERYVADLSGSIIGLVTFGDEVLGYEAVWSDKEAVTPQEWEVNPENIPPIGTAVTIVLTPFNKSE